MIGNNDEVARNVAFLTRAQMRMDLLALLHERPGTGTRLAAEKLNRPYRQVQVAICELILHGAIDNVGRDPNGRPVYEAAMTLDHYTQCYGMEDGNDERED